VAARRPSVEIDQVPRQRAEFFGPSAGQQRYDHISVQRISLGRIEPGVRLGEGQRLRRSTDRALGNLAEGDDVAFNLISSHRSVDHPIERLVEPLNSAGAERRRFACKPSVDIGRREIAQLPRTQDRNDVAPTQESVFIDRRTSPSDQAICQPVLDSISDRDCVLRERQTLLVLTHSLPQLAARLRLGSAATATDDSLARCGVADGQRCDPPLPLIPVQAALATASSSRHQAARLPLSDSKSKT
jgi:hypothetical protein